jgi:uncharacterized repeat protein (TIGR01451 family)
MTKNIFNTSNFFFEDELVEEDKKALGYNLLTPVGSNSLPIDTVVQLALELAKNQLHSFANRPNLQTQMQFAFGTGINLNGLQQAWQNQDFGVIPNIQIRSGSELGGAMGAYAQATNTIYLSEDYLNQNAANIDSITSVLLEEIGHAVDTKINIVDAPGDEGAIFSAVVQGKTFEPQQLQQLKAEDDTATIILDDQVIQIEQATTGFTSGGFEGSTKTLKLDSTGGETVQYSYEMYTIPDNLILRYEGKDILNTGFVSGSQTGTVNIPKGNSDELQVILATNDEGTAWNYTVETFAQEVNIQDAYVAVDGGSNQTATIKFTVTLSKPSDVETEVRYFTLVGTAVDGITGNDRKDYKPVTGPVTFAPGETTKEIEITVFGDKPVNYGGDGNFEIFSRDTAYRGNWKEGKDIDKIKKSSPYGDLGYRVNEVFNDTSTDFQAVGLTSDEKFFVLISDPTNADISKDSDAEKNRLLTELEKDLGGDKSSSAYQKAVKQINKLQAQDASWTFATGTIYDEGKPPVLALRGTLSGKDAWDDANPYGIGFAQFEAAKKEKILEWLQGVSHPQDTNVYFKPDITGHSLGGALTQWVASAYSLSGALGDVVTFNAPGISRAGANKFNAGNAERVTHYVTSTDIVSLAGNKFISGQYVLSNETFSLFSQIPIYGVHTHPVIVPTIIDGSDRPDLSQTAEPSVSYLNNFFFTYLPDPDYFAFLVAVAQVPVLGPTVARSLIFRGTAEAARKTIGAAIYTIDWSIEFAKETISTAWNAAKAWSATAWDAITNWGESAWNGISNWTSDAWNATTQWASDAWDATTQWTSDAWNATTQWTSDAWDATTQWTSDAWNATTQWTSDAWNATTEWSSDAWNATTEWTASAWDATTHWLSNISPFSSNLRALAALDQDQININSPWDAMTHWTPEAWNATTQWSDEAWNATTQWQLELWQATTQWSDEAWKSTTRWTDDIWQATVQFDSKAGDQILFGTTGNDLVQGGDGNDILDGGDGNDIVDAGAGNDILRGGFGNDTLTGGAGSDSFVFSTPTEGVDTITDFENGGIDRIVVSAKAFEGGLTPDTILQQSQFVLGTTAADSDNRFIYDPATGNLFFDPDGTGNTPQQEIATLTGAPSLSASDIFISGNSITPTIKITAPDSDVNGNEVTIQWNAFDADSQANISLFYDTDNQGFDGVLIADGLAETDGQGSFVWNTENVPKGDYFIYAKIVDEKHPPVYSYSKGKLKLDVADLSVTQTASANAIELGKNLTYTIQVTNNSSVTAKGVTLEETLPEEVTFVSASLTPSQQKDNIFTFNLGDLASGQSSTVEINIITPTLLTGTIASNAIVSSETSDTDTTNNVASLLTEVTAPALPDLAITRTDTSGVVNLKDPYSYNLTVTNNGSSAATGVVLTENLPSGVNYISTNTTVPLTVANDVVTANLGNLNPGESKTVNLTVSSFIAGNLISTTQVTSNEADSNPLNNLIVSRKTIDSITPASADLELTQTVDNPNPNLGDVVNFTLTLTNKGLGIASSIKVKDILPSELDFVSYIAAQGSYDSQTGVWDVGNMRDNLSRTLKLTAKVNKSGAITNAAEVIAVNETDPDSTPGNNNSNEDDQASVTLDASLATASLVKVSDDVFTIYGVADKPKLQVTLVESNSPLVNELGVFTVDDAQGKINGIAPGETGYTQAALDKSQVIFSTLANVPNGFDINNIISLLEFNSSDNLRFFLVKNGTIDSVRTGITPTTDILFSDLSSQKITDLGADSFSLAWKDGSGNKTDFKNLVVKIQSTNDSLPLGIGLQGKQQGEVIDLRGVTKDVKANLVVNREAAFDNFVGFYQVTDENGGIDVDGNGTVDFRPGDSGYAQAAVTVRVAGLDLQVDNQGTATFTDKLLTGGSIFAPFILTNGRTVEQVVNGQIDQAYFAYLGANTDNVDHIRLLGNNIFSFEDLPGGGDKDYNDVIVRVNLSVV